MGVRVVVVVVVAGQFDRLCGGRFLTSGWCVDGPRVLIKLRDFVDDYGNGIDRHVVACGRLVDCRLPVVGAEDGWNAAERKRKKSKQTGMTSTVSIS